MDAVKRYDPRDPSRGGVTLFLSFLVSLTRLHDNVRYRSYDSWLGQWLSRDSIIKDEIWSLSLYLALANQPLNRFDTTGKLDLDIRRMMWTALSSLNNVGRSFFIAAGVALKSAPATGYEVEGTLVYVGGVVIGANVMFFPETCEIASYWYATGAIVDISRLIAGKMNDVSYELVGNKLNNIGVFGKNIGASFQRVIGIPKGGGSHGADSWLEWFLTGSAALQPPKLPFSIGISLSRSDSWTVIGLGIGTPGAGGYVGKLYFSYLPTRHYGLVELKDNKCLCTALRLLNVFEPNTKCHTRPDIDLGIQH